MSTSIRVLVVDDSAFMRKVISDIINEDPRMEVVGVGRHGEDAIKKVEALDPDVITLDVEMPIMSGLEALKIIMNMKPRPVVMISSKTKIGAETTLQAIEAGAVDFITKPSGAISLDINKVANEIREKVFHSVKANLTALKQHEQKPVHITKQLPASKTNVQKVIAIGTSTGGPKALKAVITQLPASLPAPIIIVQHMPAGFTKSLAERLDRLSELTVKEAKSGDILQDGHVYIAPGGYHLELKVKSRELTIETTLEAPRKGHRPSVDTMFESLASISQIEVIAVVMTGMGTDGTLGLKELKKGPNCYSIAEAEESCVVFGMPKSVIQHELADEVVRLENISQYLLQYCQG
ncbi:chemotaxis response regulator protein-glutamate methylesterase [Bacillus sp. JCM 19034]|uniref:protein-glutamate methylesterase/protein-glutamine glutaminase n=1 Tax=Bacillus sp. JCM 19034 TaxID=1481928 RepID=UPI0018D1A5DA|nr:chemotaxis response regulator protein-glutamate methylesterase [Bacillus sp. JCM 19034]